MKQAGSARVARASSRRSRVGGHANGPEEKLSRSEVGGWRVTGDSESRDRGWGVVSRDIRDHERDAPPATGGGGTLGAHQGLSGPGGGAGAHRRRRCALETEFAEARAKLRFTNHANLPNRIHLVRRLFIRGDAGAARGRCRPRWRRVVGHRSRRWHAWCTATRCWCTSRRCSSRRSSRSARCVPRRFGSLSFVSSSSEDLVAVPQRIARLTLPLKTFASQAQYDVRLDTGIMSFRARDEPYAVTYDSVLAALQWSKAHTRRMSGPPAPPAPANAPPPFRTSSEGNRTPRTG
jgi:hypothetical protein